MVDTIQSPALGFMQVVHMQNAATLLPIINNHVAPGTIIQSDEWDAYNRIGSLPNVGSHSTVNHFTDVRRSINWNSYTACRVVLEALQDQAEMDEGLC